MKTGEEGNFGQDFLGMLLKAHHDADVDQRITVEELIDECKTLYFAGQESTASLLAWTILLLALHTDWQDKARKEVLQVFGKQNQPNHDGIAKLKTLSMIINESLRLYPPLVTVSGRTADREVRVGKLTIDPAANLELLIKPLSLHHDPDFWGQDVHLFKPERFADGVAKATNNNLAGFLPFGTGRRMCVGSDFATTEAEVVLSMILQCYSFTLSPTYVHSPYEALTLCPQHLVQVVQIVKKREEAMTGQEDYFGSDILGLLLNAHHGADDNQRISMDELIDECKIFCFAGHETTNALLSWTVLLLADWQEAARKEVLQSFGKQIPNPDGLAKLKTMSMIIDETIRLYAPVISYERTVEREVRLGKLTLPAGLELYISSLALHYEPEYWGENVHLFKPELFPEGVAKATNYNITTFLPFGMEPRICPGLNFATV
ncbi:hypothetical protein ACLB2K_039226 [Fragaria x ananassa]